MKVIERVHVEDCFDGSYIENYIIDGNISEEFIFRLKAIGELKYYPDFPRPYFQIFKRNRYLIKGVLGYKLLFCFKIDSLNKF